MSAPHIDVPAEGAIIVVDDDSPLTTHWEIDYRKNIRIYRNFDGKLLHSYFTAVSEVFLELIAPNLMILLLFRSNIKYKII